MERTALVFAIRKIRDTVTRTFNRLAAQAALDTVINRFNDGIASGDLGLDLDGDHVMFEYYIARHLRDAAVRRYDIAKAQLLSMIDAGLIIAVKPGHRATVCITHFMQCELDVQPGGTQVDIDKLIGELTAAGVDAVTVAGCIGRATVGKTPAKTFHVQPRFDGEAD